jgi:hypothetical protein
LQAHANRAFAPELSALVDIELVVAAFAFLFEEHELVVSRGDRALEFGAGIGQIRAGGVVSLGLLVELSLDLLPTRIFDAVMDPGCLIGFW